MMLSFYEREITYLQSGVGIAKYILMGLRKYIKIELQCHGFGEESIFIYHALLLKEKCRKMYWNGYVMIQA